MPKFPDVDKSACSDYPSNAMELVVDKGKEQFTTNLEIRSLFLGFCFNRPNCSFHAPGKFGEDIATCVAKFCGTYVIYCYLYK